MSRTVEVVKACLPHFTQSRYNYKMPDLFRREYSLSRIFTDLILHNYRSSQSALMTRFGTDLRHQYGIFSGKSQTSFTRNVTRAGSEEGRLFSQEWSDGFQLIPNSCCMQYHENVKLSTRDREDYTGYIKLFIGFIVVANPRSKKSSTAALLLLRTDQPTSLVFISFLVEFHWDGGIE